VIDSWKDRLPIRLFQHPFDNFAAQKNRALEHCTSDFIILADSDMTWTSNMVEELEKGVFDYGYFFDFNLYYTVIDAYHYETSSTRVGRSTRMCKNVGARYVRPIHEYLCWSGEEDPPDRMAMERRDWGSIRRDARLRDIDSVAFFENCLRKSDRALIAKCSRYIPFADRSTQAGIYMTTNPFRLRDERKRLIEDGQYAPIPDRYRQFVIEGT